LKKKCRTPPCRKIGVINRHHSPPVTLPSDSNLSSRTTNEPGSVSVMKADNLRLVSRKSGSTRIVKEHGYLSYGSLVQDLRKSWR